MLTLPSPKKPEQRWAAIKAALELRGLNLSDIARRIGVTRGAVCHARRRHYPAVERAIADALGQEPQHIWPERYGNDGLPLRQRPNARIGRPEFRRQTREV